MPLPNGAVGATCHRQPVKADARPERRREPSWLAEIDRLSEHLRRPEMSGLSQAGAVLIEGWIAA